MVDVDAAKGTSGGPAHPEDAPAGARRGVTLRAVVLGALLSALLDFLAVRSYAMVNRYSGFADHFNTVGLVFFFFTVAVLSAWVARRHPRLALQPGEMVTLYAMLMVATAIPTMGLGGYLIPLIAGVRYYASLNPGWSEHLLPYLPSWALPKSDAAAKGLFEHIAPGTPIPWADWAAPLIAWGLFAAALFLASAAAMALVRRQWVDQERLSFPLAVAPLALVEAAGGKGALFRSSLMWGGFALSAFVLLYNFALSAVPGLAALPGIPLGQSLAITPRSSVNLRADFLVIGLTYLVNADVALGLCVGQWLLLLESDYIVKMGLNPPGPAEPHAAGGPLLANQQTGALLFLAAVALWAGWKRRGSVEKPGLEILSRRGARAVLLGATAFLYAFLVATGIPPAVALLFLVLAAALFLGTTRALAESGFARLRSPHATAPLLLNFTGTAPQGGAGLPGLGLTFVWAGDIQLFLMGTIAHALKVIRDIGVRPRAVFAAMCLALVVAVATTFLTYVFLGYRHGLLGGFGWYFIASPTYHWGWVDSLAVNPQPPQVFRLMFAGLGAAGAALLSWLRLAYVGWPLHPIGLAIGMTNTVWIDWSSIFVAWLLKTAILRFTGRKGYMKALPFFLGLVLGSSVATGLTALADSFLR